MVANEEMVTSLLDESAGKADRLRTANGVLQEMAGAQRALLNDVPLPDVTSRPLYEALRLIGQGDDYPEPDFPGQFNPNGSGCAMLAVSMVLEAEQVPLGWFAKGVEMTQVVGRHVITEADRMGVEAVVVTNAGGFVDQLKEEGARGGILLMADGKGGGHVIGVVPSDAKNSRGLPGHYWVADSRGSVGILRGEEVKLPAGIYPTTAADVAILVGSPDQVVAGIVLNRREDELGPEDYLYVAMARSLG